jgi:formylglycine-generating enzyme
MAARLVARVLAVAAASGCAAQLVPAAQAEPPARRELASSPAAVSTEAPATTSEAAATAEPSPCPDGMALVEKDQRRFCIDRFEGAILYRGQPWPGNRRVDGMDAEIVAVSRVAEKPQGYISGVQARSACNNAGKRLCKPGEWITACRGPGDNQYPYGNERRANVCNDRFKVLDHHPVVTLFNEHAGPDADPRTMWMPRWMMDPRLHELPYTLAETGEFTECTNDYGVYDMVGNLHEWVDDPAGTFQGGFFMDTYQNGEGCAYRTTGHEFEYRDYSTGFRCCADADHS